MSAEGLGRVWMMIGKLLTTGEGAKFCLRASRLLQVQLQLLWPQNDERPGLHLCHFLNQFLADGASGMITVNHAVVNMTAIVQLHDVNHVQYSKCQRREAPKLDMWKRSTGQCKYSTGARQTHVHVVHHKLDMHAFVVPIEATSRHDLLS